MSNSLAGQTILVTGGCGYLGSQLIGDLAQINDIKIRILDNFQRHNQQALMGLPEHCCYEFIEGDILDPLIQRIALKNVHTVIHLAALVSTPISFTDPVWLQQVNHWGTVQLGEAALKEGIHHFIYASSTAVYGPAHSKQLRQTGLQPNFQGFRESDTCQPIGPYAESKLDAENGLRLLQTRGLELSILRFGSIYGLGSSTHFSMRFDSVVNKFCYLAGIKRALTIYGDGQQQRPVIHVRDASAAVIFIICNNSTPPNTYNVVAENPKVMELFDILNTYIGNLPLRYTEQDVLNHLSFLVSGDLLIQQGFTSSYSLQKGMTDMIDAFSSFSPLELS